MNTFYITLRKGEIIGDGTKDNPFNGNTAEKFDSALNNIPENSIINIGPGIFKTNGYIWGSKNWRPKEGWQVKGIASKTVIQLTNNTGENKPTRWVIGGDYNVYSHNSRWENLILDCNLNGQTTYPDVCNMGIVLAGNNIYLKNIKVINWGSRSPGFECFPIYVGGCNFVNKVNFSGCIVDSCIVNKPVITNIKDGTTLITCGGAYYNSDGTYNCHENPIIKNCKSDALGYPSYSHGFSSYGINCLISGNTSTNCEVGCYDDTYKTDGLKITRNIFENVQYGVYFNFHTNSRGSVDNGIFDKNAIKLSPKKHNPADNYYGFKLLGQQTTPPPYTFNTIECQNNQISFVAVPTGNYLAYSFYFYNAKDIKIVNNISNIYKDSNPNFNKQVITGKVENLFFDNNKSKTSTEIIIS